MSKESLEARKKHLEKTKDTTEVYSRIVGYYRNVRNWNKGKKQEFVERKTYKDGQDAGD